MSALDLTIVAPLIPRGRAQPAPMVYRRKICPRCSARGLPTCQGHAALRPDQSTASWQADFALFCEQYRPAQLIDYPVRLDVLGVLPRPQALCRRSDPPGLIWTGRKPDRDNLCKSVQDALRTWWRDDALCAHGEVAKAWAEKGGHPRTVIRLRDARCFGPPERLLARTFGDFGAHAPAPLPEGELAAIEQLGLRLAREGDR